ncbi:PepSY domain-containing protein [bacterium]|nr:PepSY domain-containing protein [bacterium]
MNLRRHFALFSIILLSLTSMAQRKNLTCGEESLKIDMVRQANMGKVFSCNFKFATGKMPANLRENANAQMLERLGEDHKSKFKLNYWGSFNVYDDENNRKIAAACCCDTLERYAAFYEYEPYENFKFTVILIFDKRGAVLSEERIPLANNSASFAPSITPCEAWDIAKADTEYTGKIHSITLDYSDSLGAFIWIFEKDINDNPGAFKNGEIYIHANTGKIVGRDTKLFRSESLSN